MEAGTLVEWEKKPGDRVGHGDIIAVVETQKGAIEIEAFEEGILDRYLVDIGKKVPVGTALAIIRADAEPAAAAAPPATTEPERRPATLSAPTPAREAATAPAAKVVPPPGTEATRLRASPAARRAAAAAGIDIAALRGTGPGGAIVLADVGAGGPENPSQPSASKAGNMPFDMTAMRAAIAAAMARSKREIPHYYLSHTIDLAAADRFVEERNAGRPPLERLLVGALFVKAVASALAKAPEFNGHFIDGAFRRVRRCMPAWRSTYAAAASLPPPSTMPKRSPSMLSWRRCARSSRGCGQGASGRRNCPTRRSP